MKRLSIILLMSCPAFGMITPTPTDAQIVSQALPNTTIPASLVPHVAAQIKSNQAIGQELGADTTSLIISAADAALTHKDNTTLSKTTTAVITSVATIAGAIVTALATSYSCNK